MLTPLHSILVVDDEAPIVSGYRIILKQHGFNNLVCCTDSREALACIQKQMLDVILIDLNMPYVSGEQLLDEAMKWQPDVPVIVVTGRQDIESAVRCTKKGAYDYLVKPVISERIITVVRNALRTRKLQKENELLARGYFSDEISNPEVFSEIVTGNAEMKTLFKYIEAIAQTPYPVLLTGETGAGKELIARAVHKASGRHGSFVAVNVAGLDDNMFSDTLFGHKKGAFSGAETARPGLIVSADGGTLFLDEIGDLSMMSQIKLLRLIQEHAYMPLGEDMPVETDIRVVAATNADLCVLQKDNKFRPDLFYRLNAHNIHIPPLRKRLDDLPLLVDCFLQRAADVLKKKKPASPRELIPLLAEYSFPGNVRELEQMINDAVARHKSKILSLAYFKEYIGSKGSRAGNIPDNREGMHGISGHSKFFGEELPPFSDVKRLLVDEAMNRSGGNCSRAAEILKTNRQALMWHLKKSKEQTEGQDCD